jgi:isopenicillin N synthase-like dioxygenase
VRREEIPVVRLGDARTGSDARRGRFARGLRAALCELGFVLVEDHGVDRDLIRRVHAHFAEFFGRDEAWKLSFSGVAGGQRGFTPLGVEHAVDCEAPDLKEFFHVGPERGERFGYPANLWPAGMSELRRDASALFRALEASAGHLLEALAESFELPGDAFAGMIRDGNSVLRALHYPPVSSPASGALRSAPHEDINLITLLCEATGPGLEIRPPGRDEWLPVAPAPGQIVVDSGDMLSRLTNGVIPATSHRVVNPAAGDGAHRYALPFFAHPRPDCDLSALPRFVSEERPRRHPPITAGGYLAERLREIGLGP